MQARAMLFSMTGLNLSSSSSHGPLRLEAPAANWTSTTGSLSPAAIPLASLQPRPHDSAKSPEPAADGPGPQQSSFPNDNGACNPPACLCCIECVQSRGEPAAGHPGAATLMAAGKQASSSWSWQLLLNRYMSCVPHLGLMPQGRCSMYS